MQSLPIPSTSWTLSPLEHGAFVFAGLLIYLFSTRLSHQRRPPSTAIAWVLIIALLPYLGTPLYLLFGLRKVPRARSGPRPSPIMSDEGHAHWARSLMSALSMPPLSHNDRVSFLPDGQAALDALLGMIDQAQTHLELCTFILGNDPVGKAVAAALIRAAQRGVKVRVLLDAIGSWTTPHATRQSLRHAGVEVQTFSPIWPNIRRGQVNLRNHRKMLVVDQSQFWSGGRNLAEAYFVEDKGRDAWIDLSFVVTGSLAHQASQLFQQDWAMAADTAPRIEAQPPSVLDSKQGIPAQLIPSGPDHAEDTTYALLLSTAYRAEERLVLISPYFVPDDALLSAWCMACRRGVKVTLVIPRHSNHRLADLARERSLRSLAEAGGTVFLYPTMLHAKAVVMDDELALCGSVNLDSRSLFLNYELTTAFYGPDQIRDVADWATQLIKPCDRYRPRKLSPARDLLEGLVRIIGFQL